MPIPQNQQNNRKKVRCPFCDNVLGYGNFVDGFQMYCLDKNGRACKRLLEVNVTEKGVEVVEVNARARDSPPPIQINTS
jgi:hypothetical protein